MNQPDFFWGYLPFWIVNAGMSAGDVQLDDQTLAPGEAAPLGAGALLRLAAREFLIEVE